jgi:hypothetical protein
MKRMLAAALCALLLLLPSSAGAEESPVASTKLVHLQVSETGSVVTATGAAMFGGQSPVNLGDDPAGDNVGGSATAPFGLDLRGGQISQPHPDIPEVLFEIRVEQLLPLVGGAPESTLHVWDFTVDGRSRWSLQLARTRVTSQPGSPVYGSLHECTGNGLGYSCTQQARVDRVEFSEQARAVRAYVPLALIGAGPGSTIGSWRRNLTGPVWVEGSFSGSGPLVNPMFDAVAEIAGYRVPKGKHADIGLLGPTGDFTYVDGVVAPDGSFVAQRPVPPGKQIVAVRACFTSNCDTATVEVGTGKPKPVTPVS